MINYDALRLLDYFLQHSSESFSGDGLQEAGIESSSYTDNSY